MALPFQFNENFIQLTFSLVTNAAVPSTSLVSSQQAEQAADTCVSSIHSSFSSPVFKLGDKRNATASSTLGSLEPSSQDR